MKNLDPCPNEMKGIRCDVCGGAYVCLDPWRKAATPKLRAAALNTFEQERRAAREQERAWRERMK